MNKFAILVCEDSSADQRNITLHLSQVKRSLPDLEITYKVVSFEETYNELNNAYDLLILDLGDTVSKSNAGENILMHNRGNLNIKTLVYTATADSYGWDFKSKKVEYPFLVEKLTKIHNSGENLITFVKGYIIVSTGIRQYQLYNDYDQNLKLCIRIIGENSFNYILHLIFEKYGKKRVIVYPMTAGLSGAVLFKLEIEHRFYILKLSDDILSLKQEHQNGQELYHRFPSHLTNFVVPEEYESFDKNVVGFLIKNVADAKTLFDYLASHTTQTDAVEKFLERLYLENNSLSHLYQTEKMGKVYWPSIFSTINESKISKARKAFDELKPVIQRYYQVFDFEDLRRVAISHDFGNLRSTNTLNDVYSSELVLSHGDFHSKNILIQGDDRPVIIDTGAIRYQHWCLDYARLIVHILTNGFDYGTADFFEPSTLSRDINVVHNLVNLQPIDLDGKNDNFIVALNWLTANYDTVFEKAMLFELQLGLLKEFIQVAYRTDTMPANKRSLGLISAHICLLAADKTVTKV